MTLEEISPRQAFLRLSDLEVVDVRREHEFQGPLGHVEGARLLPLPELEARVGELPRGRPLLLVCRSGVRSARACEQLAALGVGPAVNLVGGMIAWNHAGLPVKPMEARSLSELLDTVIAWVAQVSSRESGLVRAELIDGLRRNDHAVDALTRAGVALALVHVESALRQSSTPPDLELSLASFQRSLAVL